jgi:Uma2 family endonuclease
MTPPDPARGRATYADLCKVPDRYVAELVSGTLYTSPRPGVPHSVVTSGLGADLVGPYDRGRGGPGGWIILDEPELHLGDDVLVPDLAGWRRERMPKAPRSPAIELVPDWICEVQSPSTAQLDRMIKMPVYLAAGVHHIWLIDPERQLLEVLRAENGRWVLLAVHGGDQVVRAEPFDAVELDLLPLWGETREKPPAP